MMKVLLDSLSVLGDNWRLIFVILLIILLGQILIWFTIKKVIGE